MLCLPFLLPDGSLCMIFLQVAHPGSLWLDICLPSGPWCLEQYSARGGVPVDIGFPPTSYFALVDAKPLGRLSIFICFLFFLALLLCLTRQFLQLCSEFEELGQLIIFPLFCLLVCLMVSFITPSLQGARGSPDSLLYLFLAFMTVHNFLFAVTG